MPSKFYNIGDKGHITLLVHLFDILNLFFMLKKILDP